MTSNIRTLLFIAVTEPKAPVQPTEHGNQRKVHLCSKQISWTEKNRLHQRSKTKLLLRYRKYTTSNSLNTSDSKKRWKTKRTNSKAGEKNQKARSPNRPQPKDSGSQQPWWKPEAPKVTPTCPSIHGSKVLWQNWKPHDELRWQVKP